MTAIKILLLVASGIGVGVVGYLIVRKSNDQLKQEILSRVSREEWPRWIVILNHMTRQELLDTAYVMQFQENTPQRIIDQISPAIKARLAAISEKYNIFT
ncbi:MAG: hypothetical protein J7621_22390 [Niastella sp.]|nr:hypothetical protein [Niastella sp.]